MDAIKNLTKRMNTKEPLNIKENCRQNKWQTIDSHSNVVESI